MNKIKDSFSPTPIKGVSKNKEGEVLMKFSEALEVIVLGKKVRKLEWEKKKSSKDDYGFMEDDVLKIHRDGKNHRWILNKGDITGDDYVIV